MKYRHGVSYLILITLTLAILLRLIPVVVHGQPFSTDVWPLIRASEIVVTNPGVRIWCDQCFDGYNNRWPGVILSTSILSFILGLEPRYVYCFIHLTAITLAYIVLLYTLFKKLISVTPLTLFGLLYFISMPSLLIFSSSTLKEVYSYPLIFMLLSLTTNVKKNISDFAIAVIVSTALSLSHPLATVMTIGIMVSISIVLAILFILGILRENKYSNVLLKFVVLVAILSTLFAAYYFLYGRGGFKYAIDVNDIIMYMLYASFVYMSYTLSNHVDKKKVLSIFATFLAIAITTVVAMFSVTYGISFESYDIAPHILSATMPLILLWFLPREIEIAKIFNLGVAFFLSTTIAYIYIAKPELVIVLHRILNYVALLNAITISYVISRSPRISIKIIAMAITITTLILGTLCLINLVTGKDNTMFYWVYRGSETRGFTDIAKLSLEDRPLLGDSKVFYFLKMVRTVDMLPIIDILYRNTTKCCLNSILVLYNDNISKGYVTSLTIHSIGRLAGMLRHFNRVYDIGTVVGLEVL